MHKVRKKSGRRFKAWQLGKNSDMEQRLIVDEKIIHEAGIYRLMSLEVVRGGRGGEEAQAGDWFRVEQLAGDLYPFPMSEIYFRANYIHLKDDEFEAVPKILDAWFADDQISKEVQWLLDSGKLRLTNDSEKFFVAEIWGSVLSAAKDSAIVFYSVTRTDSGEISGIDFNLVAREALERDYILLE